MKATNPIGRIAGRRTATWVVALLLGIVALGAAGAVAASPTDSAVVNVNTANAEQLQYLPGVGESRAAAILQARKERGRFESVEELMEVKGIGPAMLERMRPHVTLTGRTTTGSPSPSGAASSTANRSPSGRD